MFALHPRCGTHHTVGLWDIAWRTTRRARPHWPARVVHTHWQPAPNLAKPCRACVRTDSATQHVARQSALRRCPALTGRTVQGGRWHAQCASLGCACTLAPLPGARLIHVIRTAPVHLALSLVQANVWRLFSPCSPCLCTSAAVQIRPSLSAARAHHGPGGCQHAPVQPLSPAAVELPHPHTQPRRAVQPPRCAEMKTLASSRLAISSPRFARWLHVLARCSLWPVRACASRSLWTALKPTQTAPADRQAARGARREEPRRRGHSARHWRHH